MAFFSSSNNECKNAKCKSEIIFFDIERISDKLAEDDPDVQI